MEYDDKLILSRLAGAAEKKDYFLLRDIYLSHRQELPTREGLYWDAVYYNLFGREYRSTVAAGKFLSVYGEHDQDAGEMLYIKAVNRLRTFRYRAAASSFRRLLRLHRGAMDADELEEAGSNLAVCKALRNVPPQRIVTHGVKEIPAVKTSFGHISVEVECGGLRRKFLLDTGANFSTVGLSAAREMGLVPASTGVEVGTATGIRLDCGLAHAPRITMGGIEVFNPVFIIMEDSHLSFPEIGYSIDGIIGLPVIRQLGSLRFSRDRIRIGNIRLPRHASNNICLEGLMPLAEVSARGERLTFTLDTGANQSEYSYGYYTRNAERLDVDASEYKGLRGGGGGVVKQKTLMLTGEQLSIAGRTLTVPAMNVIREDYEFSRGRDGNLGLDALMGGGGFAISFPRMALYTYERKVRKKS